MSILTAIGFSEIFKVKQVSTINLFSGTTALILKSAKEQCENLIVNQKIVFKWILENLFFVNRFYFEIFMEQYFSISKSMK